MHISPEAAKLEPNQYRCAMCDGVFERGWSEEEALAELGDNFSGFEPDDCGIVCDPCYKKMGY